MIVMQGSTSIPANDEVKDVFSGERDQIVDPSVGGAILTFYFNGSATGLSANVYVGQATPATGVTLNTQNRSPVVPDDMLMNNVPARPGEYIRGHVSNSTGGALTVFWRCEIEELARR